MNKEDSQKLAKALAKETGREWGVVEFPPGSGMYVFVMRLEKAKEIKVEEVE